MQFSFCVMFIDILCFIFYQCLLTTVTDLFKKKNCNILLSSKIILLKLWVLGLIIHHTELGISWSNL